MIPKTTPTTAPTLTYATEATMGITIGMLGIATLLVALLAVVAPVLG